MKQDEFNEAIEVAFHGALQLNKHKQHSSAADLGLLMVEAYNDAAIPVEPASKGEGFLKEFFLFVFLKKPLPFFDAERIIKIFKGFPPAEPTKIKFMKNALRFAFS